MTNNRVKTLIYKFAGNRVLQHLVFWLIAFRVLLAIFSSSSQPGRIDVIYTLIFMFTLAIPVYLNLYLLIPRFLSRKRYLFYGMGLSFLIAASVGLNYLTYDRWIDYVFKGYYFISYYDFFDLFLFFVSFIALTSLLKLSRAWFNLYETRQRLAEAEKERKNAELNALKAQVNPHFLFNSLNNIYSLSLQKSELAPEAIIKLGNVMRYVIYQSEAEFVSLQQEVELLKEYISLQKIRSGAGAKIKFKTEGLDKDFNIAPLLFLPLVENAFKHGIKGETGDSYMLISMRVEENQLSFTIDNNIGQIDKVEKEEHHGLGLENVKKRLELVYPGRHRFRIKNENDNFRVEITLNMIP